MRILCVSSLGPILVCPSSIWYHFFLLFWEVFTPAFLLGLNDSKYPHVSRTLLSILADLNDAVVWTISTCLLISKSSISFTGALGIISSTPITVISQPPSCPKFFFCSLARTTYLLGAYDEFPDFFVWALLLEYTQLKPDCHSRWISNMRSGREDILEEQYTIKFCFKLGKNDATETYGMLQTAFQASCMNRASVFAWHKWFRKAGSLWGIMRELGGVRMSIDQSWLVKGLGLVCWGFKGFQEEIPWEEATTLQIGSVAFPAGQYTIRQLHPRHRLFDQSGHQDSSSASLLSRPCSMWLCLFPKLTGCRYETIEEMKKAVTKVIDTLTQKDIHGAFQKLLVRYKCIASGGYYFDGVKSFMCVINKSAHTKKVWKLI